MIEKGTRVGGRYEVIKSIGEGGMANVYKVHDIILNRDVALKVLRGDLASNGDKFVRRFRREALAASSLSHPNIVKIYDAGFDDNLYYIVMEYIEGVTLKQLLKKRGSLTVDETLDIMRQIIAGVESAHESYIIHRDLKLQNIMIQSDGLIKITDFGIATLVNAETLTQTNSVMGSVYYLPPETASGDKANIKSDIYSIGIIFFELLTGTVPFKGDNAVEIALKHMKEPMPRVTKINPKVPQSIENIILKATAKNPKNRYEDLLEMQADLESCLDESRACEKPIEFKYQERDFNESNKIIVPSSEGNSTEIEKPQEVEIKKINPNGNKKHSTAWIAALIIPLTAFIIYMSVMLVGILEARNKSEVIPDVSDLSVEDATTTLEQAGFKVDPDIKTVVSTEVEKDKVVKTDPLASREAKLGRTITLYVSKGEQAIVLESYVGKNYIEAKTTLEKVLGLKVNIVKQEINDSSSLDEGAVISQKPKAGEKLHKGDLVTLYIADDSKKYPNFVDDKWTVDEVKEFASKYNITLTVEEIENSDYEAGTIMDQSRDAGTIVVDGASLKITVAVEK